jgi:small subunit ribosomal protein S13
MARLVGVDLPRDKRIEIALTYIYGIGRTRSHEILAATGVDPNMRVHQLGDEELVKLRDAIESNYKIEGDLRREVQADIRRKIEIGSYQGRRHRQGLPVRGQRTKTNARPQAHRRRQEEGQVTGRSAAPTSNSTRSRNRS